MKIIYFVWLFVLNLCSIQRRLLEKVFKMLPVFN